MVKTLSTMLRLGTWAPGTDVNPCALQLATRGRFKTSSSARDCRRRSAGKESEADISGRYVDAARRRPAGGDGDRSQIEF